MLLGDGTSAAQLFGPLASAPLHVWSPNNGDTQVCLPSLLACSQSDAVTQTQTSERSLPDPERSLPTEGE